MSRDPEFHAMTTPDRLLKMAEVRSRVNLSPATIYRWLKEKRFPEPIRYSETCVRWRETAIDAWIAGKSPEGSQADGTH